VKLRDAKVGGVLWWRGQRGVRADDLQGHGLVRLDADGACEGPHVVDLDTEVTAEELQPRAPRSARR
jgi:hypothetical protein